MEQIKTLGKKIKIEQLECLRCGYHWWPSIDSKTGKVLKPKTCANPLCRSPYWSKPISRPETSKALKKKGVLDDPLGSDVNV